MLVFETEPRHGNKNVIILVDDATVGQNFESGKGCG